MEPFRTSHGFIFFRRLEVDSISNPVLWEESVKRFKEVILETKLRLGFPRATRFLKIFNG